MGKSFSFDFCEKGESFCLLIAGGSYKCCTRDSKVRVYTTSYRVDCCRSDAAVELH